MHPLQRAILETLDSRVLLSVVYWYPQGSSTAWDTSAYNFNTSADGTGDQVQWQTGDDARFNGTSTRTVTVSGSLTADSISFSGSGVTLAGSGSVATGSFSNTGAFTIGGATLTVLDYGGNGGTMNLTAGSFVIASSGPFTNTGNFNIDGGSNTVIVGGGGMIDGGDVSWNSGDVTWTAGTGIFHTFTLAGGEYTFDLHGGGLDVATPTSSLTWSSGTLKLTSGGHLINDGVGGTITIPNGDTVTLDIVSGSVSGAITNNGTLHWASADLTYLGNFTNTGTVAFDADVDLSNMTLSGGAYEIANSAEADDSLIVDVDTTLTISGGTATLANFDNFGTTNLAGGTLHQTGDWGWNEVSATMVWTAGNMYVETMLGNDGYFQIAGGESSLVCAGDTGAWTGGGIWDWSSGNLSLAVAATFSGTGATATLDGGEHTLTLGAPLIANVGGSVHWESGTIVLEQNGLLRNRGGTFTIGDAAEVTLDATVGSMMGTISNQGTLHWTGTTMTYLPNITNHGTIIFDQNPTLVTLTGSSGSDEGYAYTLTIGSVSSYITAHDTITDYYVDWGDGIGFDDFTSAGNQSYTYAGNVDASTDYTITIHLIGTNGVWVNTAQWTVSVADVAPVVTLDDPDITNTTPTLTGTAGISPGDAATVTVNIYQGSDTNGTLAYTDSVDVDPDTGLFSFTLADADALPAGTYTFQATQTEAAGNTGTSAPQTFAVALQSPSIVTGLTAAPIGSHEIDLTWDLASPADFVQYFFVYYSTDYGQTFSNFAGVTDGDTTTLPVTGLTALTPYEFKVLAVNAAGYSPDEISPLTWTPSGLGTPTGLSTTLVDGGMNGVTLSWIDHSASETAYQVEADWAGTGQFVLLDTVAPLAGTGGSYNDARAYCVWPNWATETVTFRVRAVADGEASDYSNTATAHASFPGTGSVTDLTMTYADAAGVHLTWSQTGTTAYSILYRKQGNVPGEYGSWCLYGQVSQDPMPEHPTATFPLELICWSDSVQIAIQASYYTGSGAPLTNIVTPVLPQTLTAPELSMAIDAQNQEFDLSWTASAVGAHYLVVDMEPASDDAFFEPHLYDLTDTRSLAVPFSYGGYFQVVGLQDVFDGDNNWIGYNSSGLSDPIDLAIPAAPGFPTAKVLSPTEVGLNWGNDSLNETGFMVERTNDAVNWDQAQVWDDIPADQPWFIDDTVLANHTYYYRVTALRPDIVQTIDEVEVDVPRKSEPVGIASATTPALKLMVNTLVFGATNPADCHAVVRDSGVTYGAVEWQDSNFNGVIDADQVKGGYEWDYPICYTRSGTADGNVLMTIAVTFRVRGNPGTSIEIRGSGAIEGDTFGFRAVDATYHPPTGDRTDGTITATLTAGDALPSVVDADDFVMYWDVSLDGGATWASVVGLTENTIYITGGARTSGYLGNPNTPVPYYETALNIGCSAASGKSTKDEILNAVWGAFSTPPLALYRMDGKVMTYTHVPGSVNSAAAMLSSARPLGQCTAWADFLTIVLGEQGIKATPQQITPPNQNWRFRVGQVPAQGSGAKNYVFLTDFASHYVVRVDGYADRIYDPSYGNLVEKTDARSVEHKYEDEVIVAWQIRANGQWIPARSGVYHLVFH